jgi:hypothetical protein
VVNSMQDVLPPKWLVPGPGAAIDPRVPQKRRRILIAVVKYSAGKYSAAGYSTMAWMVCGAFPSSRLFTKMYEGSLRSRAREISKRSAWRVSGLGS